jgi:plasmid maintenance system antidote protein VapI
MDAMALAKLLGVTYMAVVHWVDGRRSISLTVTRLLRFFDRHPEMLVKFHNG